MGTNENASGSVEGPLLSEFRDDPDLLELVEYFVEEISNTAEKFRAASQAQDLEVLSRLSHQLKGSAGGYGFTPLTDSARVVENAVLAGEDFSEIQKNVDELIALCHRVALD